MNMQVTKVWWDGEKLMAEPIPESEIYKESAQPQQEPVAWPIDGDTARRIADKICVSYETVQQVAREFVAMQPAQPQQEPVASLAEAIRAEPTELIHKWRVLELVKDNAPQATPAQRKPLTHEQRVDLLARFEAHKHEWHASAILIDMVEAAHGITGDK